MSTPLGSYSPPNPQSLPCGCTLSDPHHQGSQGNLRPSWSNIIALPLCHDNRVLSVFLIVVKNWMATPILLVNWVYTHRKSNYTWLNKKNRHTHEGQGHALASRFFDPLTVATPLGIVKEILVLVGNQNSRRVKRSYPAFISPSSWDDLKISILMWTGRTA